MSANSPTTLCCCEVLINKFVLTINGNSAQGRMFSVGVGDDQLVGAAVCRGDMFDVELDCAVGQGRLLYVLVVGGQRHAVLVPGSLSGKHKNTACIHTILFLMLFRNFK